MQILRFERSGLFRVDIEIVVLAVVSYDLRWLSGCTPCWLSALCFLWFSSVWLRVLGRCCFWIFLHAPERMWVLALVLFLCRGSSVGPRSYCSLLNCWVFSHILFSKVFEVYRFYYGVCAWWPFWWSLTCACVLCFASADLEVGWFAIAYRKELLCHISRVLGKYFILELLLLIIAILYYLFEFRFYNWYLIKKSGYARCDDWNR